MRDCESFADGGRIVDDGASVCEGGVLGSGRESFADGGASEGGAPGEDGARSVDAGASGRCESSADGGRIIDGGASVFEVGVLGDDGGRSACEGTSVCVTAGAASD